jgi:hypothetical protein
MATAITMASYKEGDGNGNNGVGQGTATATKRVMVIARRVASNEQGRGSKGG